MKNMIVQINRMNEALDSVIDKIQEALPLLSCGWAAPIEGEEFFSELLPPRACLQGKAFFLKAYNVEDNKSLYEALLALHYYGWTPGRGGFLHIYDHCGEWVVKPLGGVITKIKAHRYAPYEVMRFDLMVSIERFAHKRLTFREISEGSYNPLVRL